MRISILGMGYVGVVSGACLVRDGHTVIGVDPVEAKVNDLNQGRSPIQEPGVAEMLAAGHRAERLTATCDPGEGIEGAEMVWVCVGTPSSLEKGIDLAHVKTVMSEIGEALRGKEKLPLIVLRSTVLPGTMAELVIPTLEESSGLKAGDDFHVVFHPEFLREGSAVADFDDPPKIVVGEAQPGGGDRLLELYRDFKAPVFRLTTSEAEMVKYCDNLFHALKVTFANEVGAIAHSAGIDARRVAEVYCADTKLNISPRYLRPGFAFGGSCLPKDLRAILRYATLHSIPTPLLRGVLDSNAAQVDSLFSRISALQPETVGMVGLAFKADTDDMRESPFVAVAKRLIGEGVRVRIYDPGVQVDNLIGGNKLAVEAALGHLRDLLAPSLEDLNDTELILINHATVDAEQVRDWLKAKIKVIDLANIKGVDRKAQGYEGIAW